MIWSAKSKSFFATATARLTFSYLSIIMLMSLTFSLAFYDTSSRSLNHQLPESAAAFRLEMRQNQDAIKRGQTVRDFLQERAGQARHELLMRLIGLNMLIFAGGSFISYYLARRTLSPIEQNIEAQSQFVTDASHELRTPLTVLQTINEVASRKPNISGKEARAIFSSNINEVIRLRQLTDSLLHLARADNLPLTAGSVDLSDAVSDALNKVIGLAIDKQMVVQDKVPKIIVKGNFDQISQAVAIILDNAIKYSPAKSRISITAKQDGRQAFLSIKDQGIGIEPKHLPHIFDRFYRADASRQKQENVQGGFGIGLALAKKIVKQHDGQITVASTPKKGSTFTIKLPLS